MRIKKICFIAPYVYPLLTREPKSLFGGAEYRVAALMRELAAYDDMKVTVVVANHGEAVRGEIDAIQVIPAAGAALGVSSLRRMGSPDPAAKKGFIAMINAVRALIIRRFFACARRVSQVLRAAVVRVRWPQVPVSKAFRNLLHGLDADLIVTIGANNLSAKVLACCEEARIASVLLLASDSDMRVEAEVGPFGFDNYGRMGILSRYCLETARTIICQTAAQQRLLETHFHRTAPVLPNPVTSFLAARVSHEERSRGRPYILWIGRADGVKRPLIFIELARRMPAVACKMVCNRSHAEVFAEVTRDIPANVELVDFLGPKDAEEAIAGAMLVVNTSSYEGFPNVMLQAGYHGVPVASLLVDPDGFISREGAGIIAGGDLDRLCAGIQHLLNDAAAYQACSAAIQRYVSGRHDAKDVGRGLHELLTATLNSHSSDAAECAVAAVQPSAPA